MIWPNGQMSLEQWGDQIVFDELLSHEGLPYEFATWIKSCRSTIMLEEARYSVATDAIQKIVNRPDLQWVKHVQWPGTIMQGGELLFENYGTLQDQFYSAFQWIMTDDCVVNEFFRLVRRVPAPSGFAQQLLASMREIERPSLKSFASFCEGVATVLPEMQDVIILSVEEWAVKERKLGGKGWNIDPMDVWFRKVVARILGHQRVFQQFLVDMAPDILGDVFCRAIQDIAGRWPSVVVFADQVRKSAAGSMTELVSASAFESAPDQCE